MPQAYHTLLHVPFPITSHSLERLMTVRFNSVFPHRGKYTHGSEKNSLCSFFLKYFQRWTGLPGEHRHMVNGSVPFSLVLRWFYSVVRFQILVPNIVTVPMVLVVQFRTIQYVRHCLEGVQVWKLCFVGNIQRYIVYSICSYLLISAPFLNPYRCCVPYLPFEGDCPPS